MGRTDRAVWDGAGTLTVRRSGGVKMIFSVEGYSLGSPSGGPGMIGLLTSIESPDNNSLAFTYETPSVEPILSRRRLVSITDSFGRTTTIEYYTSQSQRHLINKIKDFSNREFIYGYDSENRLTSVTSPTVADVGGLSNGFTSGKTRTYTYWDNEPTNPLLKYNLKTLVAPNQNASGQGVGDSRLEWEYYESGTFEGWVKSHTIGNASPGDPEIAAGGTFAYSYTLLNPTALGVDNAVTRTSVTNRLGHTAQLDFNRFGQLLHEVLDNQWVRPQQESQFPQLPATYERSYVYNDDGLLESSTGIGGTSIEATYNTSSPLRTNHAAITKVVYKSSDAADADIIVEAVQEPIFNRPFMVSDAEKNDTYLLPDYMKNLNSAKQKFSLELGVQESVIQAAFTATGMDVHPMANNLALYIFDQQCGNPVRIEHPVVTPTAAQQAAAGSNLASQAAVEELVYNDFGRLIRRKDAFGTLHTWTYANADDLNGDMANNDGVVSAFPDAGGGYLLSMTIGVDPSTSPNDGNPDLSDAEEYPALTTTYAYSLAGDPPFTNVRGFPTVITDPRGVEHRMLRNDLDQVVKSYSATATSGQSLGLPTFGYETHMLYDANNNVIETRIQNKDSLDLTVNDFIVTKMKYDILDHVVSVTANDGDGPGGKIETEFEYDANEFLTRVTRGKGSLAETTSSAVYDERGILVSMTDASNQTYAATLSTRVDLDGRIVAHVDSDPNGGDIDVWSYEYDGFDRWTSYTDRTGTKWTVEFNTRSLPTRLYAAEYDQGGNETVLSDVEFDYDDRGRRILTERHLFLYSGAGGGSALLNDNILPGDDILEHVVVYDELSRPVLTQDAEGDVFEVAYDAVGRVLKKVYPEQNEIDFKNNETLYEYDGNGNVTKVTEVEASTEVSQFTDTFVSMCDFDALNRRIRCHEPNGQQTSFDYDSRNNLIRVTDDRANEVEFDYDYHNRQVVERRYLSASGLGASSQTADPNQGGGDGVVTLWKQYDALHRIVVRGDDNIAPPINPDPTADGNGDGIADAFLPNVDYTTAYYYDDLSRVVEIEYGDQTSEEWEYNQDGEVLWHRTQRNHYGHCTYDAQGRRLSLRYRSGPSPSSSPPGGYHGTLNRTWSYDALGRVLEAFDDNSAAYAAVDDVTVKRDYDSLGRVVWESIKAGFHDETDVMLAYEGQNRLRRTIYPRQQSTDLNSSRLIVEREYDGLDRLTRVHEGGVDIATNRYIGRGLRLHKRTYGNKHGPRHDRGRLLRLESSKPGPHLETQRQFHHRGLHK